MPVPRWTCSLCGGPMILKSPTRGGAGFQLLDRIAQADLEFQPASRLNRPRFGWSIQGLAVSSWGIADASTLVSSEDPSIRVELRPRHRDWLKATDITGYRFPPAGQARTVLRVADHTAGTGRVPGAGFRTTPGSPLPGPIRRSQSYPAEAGVEAWWSAVLNSQLRIISIN
jgi:hypothetical protein